MEIKDITKEIKSNPKYKKNIKEFAVNPDGSYVFVLKNGKRLEVTKDEFHIEHVIEQANKLC